MINIKEEEKS